MMVERAVCNSLAAREEGSVTALGRLYASALQSLQQPRPRPESATQSGSL